MTEIRKMKTMIETESAFLTTYNFEENNVLIKECVDDIKNELLEYPPIFIYGKKCFQHRSIGFYSDDSIGYYYSRQLCKSKPLNDNLKILLEKVNKLYNSEFNGILINKYLNGTDYIGKHSDDEKKIDPIGVISLSFGAVRKFRIRDKKNGKIIKDVPTLSNYLIHMGGAFQTEFTHEIPIEKKVKEVRYSFTFRKHNK